MSSFAIFGGLLALTALVVAVLGIRSADFPATPRAERIVMVVFAVLVVGAVASGIVSSSNEYAEKQAAKAAP